MFLVIHVPYGHFRSETHERNGKGLKEICGHLSTTFVLDGEALTVSEFVDCAGVGDYATILGGYFEHIVRIR